MDVLETANHFKLVDYMLDVAEEKITIKEIIEFHFRFERIHPFQDGNGRVGRIIAFKECSNYCFR